MRRFRSTRSRRQNFARFRHACRLERLENRRLLASLSFAPPVAYDSGYPIAGDLAAAVAAGDFNDDGAADLLATVPDTTNNRAASLVMLTNAGSGDFVTPRISQFKRGLSNMTTGDLNGDGFLDVAIGHGWQFSVLLNDGSGELNYSETLRTTGACGSIAIGDVDGDGVADVVTANGYRDFVSVFINNGDGTLESEVAFPARASSTVALADFDADGDLDVATAYGDIQVLLNNGDGSFGAPTDIASQGYWLETADFNGDGLPDLANADSREAGEVSVLINSGNGSFAPEVRYPAGRYSWQVEAADFNGDGHLDVATISPRDGLAVLVNNGDGTFAPPQRFAAGLSPKRLALADFDGDGDVDVAALDQAPFVKVMMNTTVLPNSPPVATDDSYELDEDDQLLVDVASGVLVNDSDVDGDVLQAEVTDLPVNGSLTFDANGSFAYIPDPDFHGTDSFTYVATDGSDNSDPATVEIIVHSVVDVVIDVKPGSTTNPVNLASRGFLPLVIYSTQSAQGEKDDFDVRSLDLASTTLNGKTVQSARAAYEDVDGDGDDDVVLHFSVPELVESGVLRSDTVDLIFAADLLEGGAQGMELSGSDSVRILSPKKNGRDR